MVQGAGAPGDTQHMGKRCARQGAQSSGRCRAASFGPAGVSDLRGRARLWCCPKGPLGQEGQAGWHQAALGMGPLEEPMWPPAGSHEGALRSLPGVGVNGTFTEVKESQSGLHERWGLGGYGDTQGQLRP